MQPQPRSPFAVVYAGHMPDAVQAQARFPAETEAAVAAQAAALMAGYKAAGASAAVGSLAAGADLLLAEAALDAGLALTAVVPDTLDAFIISSITPTDADGRWQAMLSQILPQVAEFVELTPVPGYANGYAQANAAMLAKALALAPSAHALLVLADAPRPGQAPAPGGTAHFAEYLAQNNIAMDVIDPLQPAQPQLPPAPDLPALLPHFGKLDKEAVYNQRAWTRRLYGMLALFATLMLITGMEDMENSAMHGKGRQLRLAAIGATVLGLAAEAGFGLKPNRRHKAWVRARAQAEGLRAAAWAHLMGMPPLALEGDLAAHASTPALDTLATELEKLPALGPQGRWAYYGKYRLQDQAAYYARTSHNLHTLATRLIKVKYAFITGAMLWGIVRFVSELPMLKGYMKLISPELFHDYHVLGVSIALVSLLHVWLESTQAHRLTGRYKALARALEALAHRLITADTEAAAAHTAREAEELLLAQNEEWIGVVG